MLENLEPSCSILEQAGVAKPTGRRGLGQAVRDRSTQTGRPGRDGKDDVDELVVGLPQTRVQHPSVLSVGARRFEAPDSSTSPTERLLPRVDLTSSNKFNITTGRIV